MNLVDRVKSILLKPKNEWEIINNESYDVKALYTKYIVILAAIPAVAGILGFSIFGVSTPFGSFRLPLGESIRWGIITYVMALISVFIVGYVIDVLAPTFGSNKKLEESMKLVAFANTAVWVGGIFNIIPSFSILATIAGIYSLVLLYFGLPVIKSVPKEKVVGYFIAIIVVTIIVYIIVGAIVSTAAFGGNMVSSFNY